MKDSQTGSVSSLVATAATDGADAAVREGERAFSDDKARAAALQSAAQTLMLARRYPEAAALMERAGRQSDNAAALLSIAEILRQARRHEEILLPPDQPRDAGPPADGADRRRRARRQAGCRPLLPRPRRRLPQDGRDAGPAWPSRRGSPRPASSSALAGRAGDVAIDLALGALQETVSGDDATGYRVGFSFPLETERRATSWSTSCREGGRVPDRGDRAPPLDARRRGPAAASSAATSPGARKWLDWAREDGDRRTGRAAPIPLPRSPFPALWAKGSAAPPPRRSAAPPPSCSPTRGARRRRCRLLTPAARRPTDPARRNAFDLALALADAAAGRFAEMEETSRRLLAAAPGSERAERPPGPGPRGLGRWDEVRALAERRLQRRPTTPGPSGCSPAAPCAPATSTRPRRGCGRSSSPARPRRTTSTSSPGCCLERGRVDDETLDFGQRAATLSRLQAAPPTCTPSPPSTPRRGARRRPTASSCSRSTRAPTRPPARTTGTSSAASPSSTACRTWRASTTSACRRPRARTASRCPPTPWPPAAWRHWEEERKSPRAGPRCKL